MFARTLVELGKDYELKFYLTELEKIYTATNSPEIAFQMGVIYSMGSFANMQLSKKIFEKVLTNCKDKKTATKTKMFLANIYDSQNDVASCRRLVDTMEVTEDAPLNTLVNIWKAKVFKDEGKVEESKKIIEQTIKETSIETDWYGYFSAMIIFISLMLKEKKKESALHTLNQLRIEFSGKNYKSLQDQINSLEKKIIESDSMGVLTVDESEDILILSFETRKVEIEKRSSIGKLIKSFIKNETLNKTQLIKVIYDREYAGESDNKLIYYHIHYLRKEIEKIGLRSAAIEKCAEGYRLAPEVISVKGEVQT